jgi:hypothetical protein
MVVGGLCRVLGREVLMVFVLGGKTLWFRFSLVKRAQDVVMIVGVARSIVAE